MGRIRTIKPEFPQSESMGNVSREARLLFLLLFTFVDDSGRARGNSRMLASLLYPYDEDAPTLIDDWLDELCAEGCIALYSVDGNTYLQICKWLEHQKIDKPTKSKIPEFAESSRILARIPRKVDDGPGPGPGPGPGSRTVDLGSGPGSDQNPPAVVTEKPKRQKREKPDPNSPEQIACRETWKSYSLAYRNRYQVDPIRNAKMNSLVKQFVRLVGHSEAPQVAA